MSTVLELFPECGVFLNSTVGSVSFLVLNVGFEFIPVSLNNTSVSVTDGNGNQWNSTAVWPAPDQENFFAKLVCGPLGTPITPPPPRGPGPGGLHLPEDPAPISAGSISITITTTTGSQISIPEAPVVYVND